MSNFSGYIEAAEQLGYQVPAGAPTNAVAGISAAFSRLFETELPSDYANFLRSCDGFEVDGASFYGLVDAWDEDGAFLGGLFDSNERLLHGSQTISTPLRFVGESGHELYAFDVSDQQWKIVDRTSWDSSGANHFPSFTELFAAVYAYRLP